MKLITLIENNPDDKESLLYEHGLSVYLEVNDKKILFDTGQSSAFLKNAERLGVDLEQLDYCILSHGHYDHTGGLTAFIDRAKHRPTIVVGQGFFEKKYRIKEDQEYKYNGNSFTEKFFIEKQLDYLEIKESMIELSSDIMLFSNIKSKTIYEEPDEAFYIQKENSFLRDRFRDEIILGIKTKMGIVLLTGCGHNGIVNIVCHVKENTGLPIYAVIGGTHLIGSDKEKIVKTVNALKNEDVKKIAVSHCTGAEGMEQFQETFGDRYYYNKTGSVLEF